MKAWEHPSWTDESANFPETFNWSLLVSPKLETAAHRIVGAIEDDFRTPERNLVPGLREALRLIAMTTDVL